LIFLLKLFYHSQLVTIGIYRRAAATVSTFIYWPSYRAMHFSAKRGIAIACRLSVCDVGGL